MFLICSHMRDDSRGCGSLGRNPTAGTTEWGPRLGMGHRLTDLGIGVLTMKTAHAAGGQLRSPQRSRYDVECRVVTRDMLSYVDKRDSDGGEP
jgi:hypothetical protein